MIPPVRTQGQIDVQITAGRRPLPFSGGCRARQPLTSPSFHQWTGRAAAPPDETAEGFGYTESPWVSFLGSLVGSDCFRERFGLSVVLVFGFDRGAVVEFWENPPSTKPGAIHTYVLIPNMVQTPCVPYQDIGDSSASGGHVPRARRRARHDVHTHCSRGW